MLAYAGIEAASDLAPDIDVSPRDLKRIVSVGALAVPLVYAGMAAIALMAVPVVAGPARPANRARQRIRRGAGARRRLRLPPGLGRRHDALAGRRWSPRRSCSGPRRPRCSASPATSTRWRSTARSPAGWASSTAATRRRTWRSRSRGVIAIGLVLPTNVKLLAGIYAFGATLAITIAHLSIIRLRVTEPDRAAPLPDPLGRRLGRRRAAAAGDLRRPAQRPRLHQRPRLPHDRPLGRRSAGWPSASLFYVIYRKVFEGTTLTKRVSVTEQALTKQVPEVDFRNILVPVFGTKLDDDIVATAGRLAAAEQEDAGGEADDARLDLVYVIEVPLTPAARREAAAGARGARRGGRWSGRARSGRSTRTSRCAPR